MCNSVDILVKKGGFSHWRKSDKCSGQVIVNFSRITERLKEEFPSKDCIFKSGQIVVAQP